MAMDVQWIDLEMPTGQDALGGDNATRC